MKKFSKTKHVTNQPVSPPQKKGGGHEGACSDCSSKAPSLGRQFCIYKTVLLPFQNVEKYIKDLNHRQYIYSTPNYVYF